MLDNKLCLTSVVEYLRRGRVDRGTIEGKVVVVVDSSKRKVASSILQSTTTGELLHEAKLTPKKAEEESR